VFLWVKNPQSDGAGDTYANTLQASPREPRSRRRAGRYPRAAPRDGRFVLRRLRADEQRTPRRGDVARRYAAHNVRFHLRQRHRFF
jgi:hypothetical protein